MMLDHREVESEENKIRFEVSQLSEEKRRRYYAEFEQRVKDPDTYATLNFLFITGLHHFYLGQITRGSINLIAFLLAIWLMIFVSILFGFLLLLAVTLTEVYALFRAQIIVQNHNNATSRKIMSSLK